MRLIRLKKLHVTKGRFLQTYFDTEYDLDIDQCDLNKRNEILSELVKFIADRNPFNTEFIIGNYAEKRSEKNFKKDVQSISLPDSN